MGEPLPPGEENPANSACLLLSVYRPLTPPPACPPREICRTPLPQDMELEDSGDDAETRFFQDQAAALEFPPSVWGFLEKQTNNIAKSPPSPPPPETTVSELAEHPPSFQEVLDTRPIESSKEGRKRRESVRKEVLAKKRRKSSGGVEKIKGEEEEEEMLRALLLAQVSRPKEAAATGANKENTVLVPRVEIDDQISAGLKTDLAAIKKVSPGAPVRRQDAKTRRSVVIPVAVKKVETSMPRQVKRPPGAKPAPSAIKRMSQKERDKHFPNLVKKLVIPLTGLDSDSEEERDAAKSVSATRAVGTGEDFGLNLDSFLKQVRSAATATPSGAAARRRSKATQLRSQIQVKAVTPQMKARAKALTPADKRKLIYSNISHLPLQKQQEYIRLKQLIARKEKLKQQGSAQQQQIVDKRQSKQSSPVRSTKVVPKLVSKSESLSSSSSVAPAVKLVSGGTGTPKNTQVIVTTAVMSTKQLVSSPNAWPAVPTRSAKSNNSSVSSKAVKKDDINRDLPKPDRNHTAGNRASDPDSSSAIPVQDDEESQLRNCLLNELSMKQKKQGSSAEHTKTPAVLAKIVDKPSTRSTLQSPAKAQRRGENVTATTAVTATSTTMISTQNKLRVMVSGNGRDVTIPQRANQSLTTTTDRGRPADKIRTRGPGRPTAGSKAAPPAEEKKCPAVVVPCLTVKEGARPEKVSELKECETTVVKIRQTLSNNLYKLSAQMSQLQKHTHELTSAEKYAAELRQVFTTLFFPSCYFVDVMTRLQLMLP